MKIGGIIAINVCFENMNLNLNKISLFEHSD